MADNVGHALLGIWKKLFFDSVGDKYVGNLYRDSAQLRALSKEIGKDTLIDVMNYYFDTTTRPSFEYFIFNYDKILEQKNRYEEDQYRRELLRKRTKRRIEEMGIPVGHDGTVMPPDKENDN
jgi:hypothetical protein